MQQTVIEHVVKKGLCVGCGVCAGVCPKHVLSMKFNEFGEYNASGDKTCDVNCGLCLKVCPFFLKNENEDVLGKEYYANIEDIQYRKETGYFLGSYYGYSMENNHRARGASGGLTTWLLENLLSQGKIDFVVCVTPNNDPEKLFKFQVLSSIEDVRNAAGSAYYPVELSEVVEFIRAHEGRYALVGLPCFIKAIRLAQRRSLTLKDRIKYLLGLTCGQMKSKYYACFLSAMTGVVGTAKQVFFRRKSPSRRADNYAFEVETTDGGRRELCVANGVNAIWVDRWFTLQACDYCDDVFAELADVVLMDAWLPEYVKDSAGANLLIIRSLEIDRIFVDAKEGGQIQLNKILMGRLIDSQSGVLKVKRDYLAYRLFCAQKEDRKCLLKRILPSNTLSFFEKKGVLIRNRIQKRSREELIKMKTNGVVDVARMFFVLKLDLMELNFWNKCQIFFGFPVKVLSRIQRTINAAK